MSAVPRVSVVLPFRDAAATLAEALHSLAAQTMTAFECLLVDDGSLDSSAGLARATAARDPRFRVLRAPGGLVDALNRGIGAARADVICRMDADDVSHPARLACQLQALEAAPDVAVMSCLVCCFSDAGIGAGMRRYETWLNGLRTPEAIRNALFVESPIPHPSAMIRRAALAAVHGYRLGDGPEDYDLWLRLLLGGRRAAKVERVLLAWRDSPGRLSRVDSRYHRQRFFSTKLRYLPAVVPPGTAVQICGAGPTGRAWARALTARGYSVDRFIDVAPRRWGSSIDGIPVRRPDGLTRTAGFVLAAAGSPGARERIEAWLRGGGLRPWDDYLAVA